MGFPIAAQMARHPVTRHALLPRFIDDVVQPADLGVAPDVGMPVLHRFQGVVFPAQGPPAAAEEVGEEILVRELVGGEEVGGGLEVVVEVRP